MKQLTEKQFEDLFENLQKLESSLQDRISEYHEVKGMQSERHAFCYYRRFVWNIQGILSLATKVEPPKQQNNG